MNTYILEKRTSEIIWYDLDCTNILDPLEKILNIISVTADQTGLTFNAPAVNGSEVIFSDGTIGEIGKVISVQISGGVIPAPQLNQLYTIRALFFTDGNNTREATVLLNVINVPMQVGRVI